MNLQRFLCLAAAGTLAVTSSVSGQEPSKEVKVDFKRVEAQAQNTPQIPAANTKDKRWNPKIWLEIDAGFGLKKARVPGDTNPMVDSLDFKFYLLLNKRDKDGKLTLLTASISYLNANEDDRESHAMAFVSPSALARVLENPRVTQADITPMAVGIEVFKGGALAGGYSQGGPGGKWWEKAENFNVVDGVLLPKAKTPFAVLWGDYDLETKQ